MKNNFDYSIELISKMSDMLRPDFLNVMRREVARSEYIIPEHPKYSKSEAIDKIVELMRDWKIITSSEICGSNKWMFAFNCNDRDIYMTACESNSGTSFRYMVNNFDETDFNDTFDYIAVTAIKTLNELKKEIKQ